MCSSDHVTFSNSETNRMTMSVTTAVSGIVVIVLSISGTEHLLYTLKVFSPVIWYIWYIYKYIYLLDIILEHCML